ncbi:methyltransferase [Geodermatophilus sp. DSM 45219]|uniref:methyltransferase n=1 Tax=Geodermatophilus sp. DSM 45219 TaxID=1881103 RepID=UPI000884A182|nr:methyltransferase [Geodermatophilus sp. DSM 45219]SDN52710.1 Methyltransferase small domain-containing protein [Geodermatophilus sp. DSM 45219]
MDQVALNRGWRLYNRHVSDDSRPTEFHLCGRTWDLRPGVFSPTYSPVTELFTSWIPYPTAGSFLEIGSGAGVTAVTAALLGCRSVTAVDISPAAVENTRRNAARHGVEEAVDVLQSDLFDALPPGRRYDRIYWNSGFVELPSQYVCSTDLHRAFFDPGYEGHRRFIRQGRELLADGGSMLLGFSSIGSWPLLREICGECATDVRVLQSARRRPDGVDVDFQLLELRPL